MGSRVALPHNLGGGDGQHCRAKVVVGLHPFLVCEVRVLQVLDALLGQQGAHPLEELALDLNEAGDHLVDGRQLLLGTHAALVVHVLGGDGGHIHQTPHPDHEKLVQVAGKNGDKLQPFQGGDGVVGRLLQDPAVEAQPAEFSVLGIAVIR